MQLKGDQQVPISGIQFNAVAAAPGDLTNIVLQTKAGQVFANVPILLPDGYYADAGDRRPHDRHGDDLRRRRPPSPRRSPTTPAPTDAASRTRVAGQLASNL